MSFRPTLEHLLYRWLNTTALTARPRFAAHSRETFDAVLDTCERIARDKYAPFNRLVDTQEPRTEMGADGALRVVLPQATHDAFAAYVESGMLAAAQDEALGGMQLPYSVEAAANAFFALGSISIGSQLLSVGNANAILAHGSPAQQHVFAANELSGRWAGTMCLSEPQAGSSLSDITTRAELEDANDPLGPRYRLRGNKMWISSGEHDLTENIVHLVLAKVPGPDGQLRPGTKSISLFIVPKRMVAPDGELTGERNDVVLAGLNHKLGWRGTTNTLLNFGEGAFKPDGRAGAVGYRVGPEGDGLRCMFHMMNEARIGIGMAATMLGLAGYYASLDYARQRPQGRPITASGKASHAAQSLLIEHADIRRMLLAQKAYGEGALALQLYCARLVDDLKTGTPEQAHAAHELLEVLTPIAKSWPSEFCLEANSLAIQIHGGYGYTRDFPVEQFWRDQRLNMIHEGTHGIQALDLLGRKVVQGGGAGLKTLAHAINATIDQAGATPGWAVQANALAGALQRVGAATKAAWATGDPADALPNAVPYMQAFGHVVLAWMWLDVVATTDAAAQASDAASVGRRQAARYFFNFELPRIDAWLRVVEQRDRTCADTPADAF
jgi:alkylation response protein AidB-like acyl-CoA dehydrogenase